MNTITADAFETAFKRTSKEYPDLRKDLASKAKNKLCEFRKKYPSVKLSCLLTQTLTACSFTGKKRAAYRAFLEELLLPTGNSIEQKNPDREDEERMFGLPLSAHHKCSRAAQRQRHDVGDLIPKDLY